MSLRSMFEALKRFLFVLRRKGIRYACNFIYFNLFWVKRYGFINRLLYWIQPYPFFIEIEVTTRCNLKCLICEHTYWKEPAIDMSLDDFKKIIYQFPKLKWIGLTGIGESFLNRDFINMLRFVKSKGIMVELYDTFYFIDAGMAGELIDMQVDRVFVSLDAATKKTYERIRAGSDFEKVTGNIKDMFRIKKENKAYFPEIMFHYIVTKENISEAEQYIELVYSISNGQAKIVQFSRMLHNFKEIKSYFTEVPEQLIQAIQQKAKKFGIKVIWNEDVPKSKPSINKCIEWTMPFIFATGDVISCCAGNESGNRGFQKETALGNIFKQDFKEIWHGEKYKALRNLLKTGAAPISCKNCALYIRKDT